METPLSGTVVVVDDDPYVLESVSMVLTVRGFDVHPCSDGARALAKLAELCPDTVLTDVNMPRLTGIELLGRIRELYPDVPVVLMTAYAELGMAVSAIKMGAFDFLIKPFKPPYLIHAVEKGINFKRLLLVEKNYKAELERTVELRTRELACALASMRSMSLETIERLTAAAELRDEDTGRHIARIGLYAKRLAEELSMPPEFVETIAVAATMHDVGKIGIPDSILLKHGPLTTEEFATMKGHTLIGGRILAGSSHGVLQMAASIAMTHHERWDGSGYPRGLAGPEIPLEGRIVMMVDQYDALRSKRVYKPAFPHDKTFDIITVGDGRTMLDHFDPAVLDAFRRAAPELAQIFTATGDPDAYPAGQAGADADA